MYAKFIKSSLFTVCLAVGSFIGQVSSQHTTEGRIAVGAFLPTGDDADIAKTSFALQLIGDVQLAGRWSVEAEFNWIPLNLESSSRPAGTLIEARQIGAVAGLRLSTIALGLDDDRPAAYIAGRIGFSRIAVTSATTASISGWIGRTLDATQNLPPFSFPIRATENAFVISPRAGFLFRLAKNALIDISITPSFLFDGGKVTTQIMATVGFGMLGTLD